MKKLLFIALAGMIIAGCSKMEEKKPGSETKNNVQNENEMPNPHGDMTGMDNMNSDELGKMDMQTESGKDPKAGEISKTAFDFEKSYEKDKSAGNKKLLIEKHMAAGNYLMFEANVPPKEKYGPALKHFRRVLELEPGNAEADRNKKQIEEIYEMMGRPIPQ